MTSYGSNNIRLFNPTTGAFINNFVAAGSGGLFLPDTITFSVPGIALVSSLGSSYGSNEVKRYDVSTGAFLGNFIGPGNGLDGPGALLFVGNDLLVSSYNNNRIIKYDGLSGNYLSTFELGTGLVNPALIVLDRSAVPEPGCLALIGIGTLAGCWWKLSRLKGSIAQHRP